MVNALKTAANNSFMDFESEREMEDVVANRYGMPAKKRNSS